MLDGRQAQPARRVLSPAAQRREQGVAESQLLRFLQALLYLTHSPHLAPQADLAEDHGPSWHRPIESRGDERRCYRQIGRGLADSESPGDVQIYVMGTKSKSAAGLQHGQHHGETT